MTPAAVVDLEALAREAGAVELAREAGLVAERLSEGRFDVACVGQFKRGKSTLINALVGEAVLPAGVVPVTSVVTVVRWGERRAARVRFGHRAWEDCDPGALEIYVSEEHNPSNEKDVSGVEVFVPSPLLAGGLCLVDTPGIASISVASTAATRAFVPHVDAALVVLGADPPISGAELDLVEALAGTVGEMVFVLNKADRLPETERAEAVRYTARVLGERLRRPVGPILQVSAAERLAGHGPARLGGARRPAPGACPRLGRRPRARGRGPRDTRAGRAAAGGAGPAAGGADAAPGRVGGGGRAEPAHGGGASPGGAGAADDGGRGPSDADARGGARCVPGGGGRRGPARPAGAPGRRLPDRRPAAGPGGGGGDEVARQVLERWRR